MAERMPPREVLGILVLILGILASIALAFSFLNAATIYAWRTDFPRSQPYVPDLTTRFGAYSFLSELSAALSIYLTKLLIRPGTKKGSGAFSRLPPL